MPPALERLLASPSALRVLRSIVNAPALPAACFAAPTCCPPVAARCEYSNEPYRPDHLAEKKWRRFKDAAKKAVVRDRVRESLLRDDAQPALEPVVNIFETDAIRIAKREDDPAQLAVRLAHYERVLGSQGVRKLWEEIRYRRFSLPTDETSDAEFLWGTFSKEHLLVPKLIEHAEDLLRKTGRTHPRLYELVMRHWLPKRSTTALNYHRLLLEKVKPEKLPLRQLARSGRSTFKVGAYETLMEMYKDSNERDLYDDVVPALIEKGGIAMARQWHALCTARGDLPSEAVASHPVVRIFTIETSTTEVSSGEKSTAEEQAREAGRYNQKLLRRLSGPDTAPVRFEDSFVARMFGTKSFPPASIIQGLAMVGVNEIGPQAVLTMATRTQPLEELKTRFEELKAAGIALQGCVFSLALEKFVFERKWQLVRSMIESDQHPDVFGDADVQRKLLEYYLDKQDYLQAQRTLAILTLFLNDASQESWNLLLQVHIQRTGPRHVMQVLRDMRTRGVMLTRESVIAIRGLLRRRQRGHQPVMTSRPQFDDLLFVARAFMMILETALAPISPPLWREIIRRFGMLGRFRELRRLLLWLLCWYAPRSSVQFAKLPKSPFLDTATKELRAAYPLRSHYFHYPATTTQHNDPLHPIRRLIRPSLYQALIIWGFRAALLPNAPLEQHRFGPTLAKKHYRRRLLQRRILNRLDWSVGLRTVVQLRELGVHVSYHTVIKALQMQFIVLFGRGRSNRKVNRIMETTNRLSYALYVHEANQIWGSQLLREPQLFAKHRMQDHMWHPRLRRKIDRVAYLSLGEILGPNWANRGQHEHVQRRNRVAEVEDRAALQELQKNFEEQADVRKPGFDFLSLPGSRRVKLVWVDRDAGSEGNSGSASKR
ncbi:hypothetical protein BDW02DRAFT_627368 [Decorospora gaudefroyi]|uniref:Pentatricopeptide repeat domain-containing protein n=1 Tax=Decorospora gaudefroyi TaxID=184978 RepID=A0A6A5KQG9_9PLEO|nr:hypothetical protein BDW02DRAFT_627368 [Decorospora gaudefroyi]